jgi:type I restriction enzyme, R subunit
MSEYANVERPFLDKLRQLGWEAPDHGTGFIPQDHGVSKRTTFREIILEQEFRASLKRINLTDDRRPWLTY